MKFKEFMQNVPGAESHALNMKMAKKPNLKKQIGTMKSIIKPARPAGLTTKNNMTIPSVL